MTSLGLKSLWARKFRALTTTFAVVIGVAFMAGSYVLTDTIFAAFDEIFGEAREGTSVVISSKEFVEQENGEVPPISADLLPAVKSTPGVELASGAIFTQGGLFDEDGDSIGAKFQPKFISSVLPGRLGSFNYLEGHPARGPGEVALDKVTAEDAGIAIGDTVTVVGRIPAQEFEVVGIGQLGDSATGGFSIAQLTLPEAQRVTAKEGEFDQIAVAAKPGVSEEQLKRRIQQRMPPSVLVETGVESADRNTDEIRDDLGFLQTMLLVFAFIALFVGAFLIFNTFSITVAQRITEFGMLRTLGASRGQILRTVVAEAFAIGLIGALIGIGGGFVIAVLLKALFEAIGASLPTTGLVLEARTVIVSLLVGVGVTVVSSLIPALRSTRVPPIAALHADIAEPSRRRRMLNQVLAGLLGLVGLAVLLYGLFGGAEGGSAAASMGVGAVMIIIAVSLFSPLLVRPLASLAGWPLERLRRLTGRLARENAQRNPGRTAITAAALMIGVALVAFVTIFAAGLRTSISSAVDDTFQGDLVIQNTDGFSPIPPGAAAAAEDVEGVDLVASLRLTEARVLDGGGKVAVNSLSGGSGEVFELEWDEGNPELLNELADDEAAIEDSLASSNGLEVGDSFRILSPTGARPTFRVAGIYESDIELIGKVLVTPEVMGRDFDQTQDVIDFVQLSQGADSGAVQASLQAVMEREYPTAEVVNQTELKDFYEEQVNQLLTLIYALLAMAVLISVFGIANTLALSIHERTRELGMVRAIGMSRRQVRTMIRYESVITALIGSILGLALGIVFAVLIAQPLRDEGFSLSFPIGSLLTLVVVGAIAGVLAAILPARRASRLDVLKSLQYE